MKMVIVLYLRLLEQAFPIKGVTIRLKSRVNRRAIAIGGKKVFFPNV